MAEGEIEYTDKEAWLRMCPACGKQFFGLCGERPSRDEKCCGIPLTEMARYTSDKDAVEYEEDDPGDEWKGASTT